MPEESGNLAANIRSILIDKAVGIHGQDYRPNEELTGKESWPINLFYEPIGKHRIITIFLTGSHQKPNPKWLVDYPTFQVRLRGRALEGGEATYAKAREVRDHLLGRASEDLIEPGGMRLVSITMPSDIMFLGTTDNECTLFVCNFNCIVEPNKTDQSNREPL